MLILTETSGRVTDSGSLTWENLTVYFTCRGVAAGVAVDTLAASLLLLTLSVHVAGTDSSHSKLSLSLSVCRLFPGFTGSSHTVSHSFHSLHSSQLQSAGS